MEEFFDTLVGSRVISYEITDGGRSRLVLSFFDKRQTTTIRLACRSNLRCKWIDESPPDLGRFSKLLKEIVDTARGPEVELVKAANIIGHCDPDCGRKMWFAELRFELRWGDYKIILKNLSGSGSWPPSVPFPGGTSVK